MMEQFGKMRAPRLAVIDYEAGNLPSVTRALRRAGAEVVVIRRPDEAPPCDGAVLPGVGAFGSAMARLAAVGFPEWLRVQVARGTPLVGVCLGMQLLFERSEESAEVAGLGILPGDVRRLPAGLKVPHMGWNRLIVQERRSLLDGIPDGAFVYFVHSYVAQPDQPVEVVASTSYGVEFPAIVQCGRVIGMQFHPEKSGEIGQRLLRHLVGWVAGTRSARSVPQPS